MKLSELRRFVTRSISYLTITVILFATFSVALHGQQYVYVSNPQTNNVVVVNTTSLMTAATISIGSGEVLALATSPDGIRLYATNEISISVINTSTNTIVATIPLPGAYNVAFSGDGSRAYVTDSVGVAIINVSSNQLLGHIPLPLEGSYLALTPDGGHAYVSVPNGTVYFLDLVAQKVIAKIPIPGASDLRGVAVTPDGKSAYVVSVYSSNVTVINTASNTVVTQIPVGFLPIGIGITPDGTRAYVTASYGPVSVININTNTVVAQVSVNNHPADVAVSADGSSVYVTDQIQAVDQINTSTNTVVAEIPVGGDAYGVALSAVPYCSGGAAISAIQPTTGGNAGTVTAAISGCGFSAGANAKLSASGQADIVGSNTTVVNSTTVTTTFNLTGATPGLRDVVVSPATGPPLTLPQSFTIQQGGAPNVTVSIVGRDEIRFGKTATYAIVASNTGSVDSGPSLISVEIPPFLQSAQLPGANMFGVGETTKPYFGIPGNNPGGDQFLVFATSGIPAGGTQTAPIQLTLPPGQGSNFTVTAGWELYLSNLSLDDTLNRLGFPFVEYNGSCGACLNAYSAETFAYMALESPFQAYSDAKTKFQQQLAKTAADLVGGVVLAGVVSPLLAELGVTGFGGVVINDMIAILRNCANGYLADQSTQNCVLSEQTAVNIVENGVKGLLTGQLSELEKRLLNGLLAALKLIQAGLLDFDALDADSNSTDTTYQTFIQDLPPYEQARVNYITCLSNQQNCSGPPMQPPPLPPPGTGTLPVTGIGSLDPNDKVGPTGAGAQGYVIGAAPFSYNVLFGNKDNASAPAQQVVITDQLDLTKYNLKSFSLASMGFGAQIATPPPDQTGFTSTIDLRPTTNLLVNLNAVLNPNTGLVNWSFTSIDPATGQPPTDPTVGFLPPGANGYVLFNVTPKQGLPTNTQIQNLATITFDANPPINTPTWLNTLDNTPPTSKVSALPGTESCANFQVAWSGNDVGSGVQNFTVYVSDNGANFVLWLTNTTLASSIFQGQVGHTYGFYSIATDLVANVEPSKSAAEASTQVTSGNSCGPPNLSGSASVNSYSQGILSLNLQLSDIGTADALNVMINQLTFRTLSGSGKVTLASPTLPISVGNIPVDNSSPVTLTLNVPTTVNKFSITESGTMQDSGGKKYNYSIGQVVVP